MNFIILEVETVDIRYLNAKFNFLSVALSFFKMESDICTFLSLIFKTSSKFEISSHRFMVKRCTKGKLKYCFLILSPQNGMLPFSVIPFPKQHKQDEQLMTAESSFQTPMDQHINFNAILLTDRIAM